ncbi:LysR family transcriptional regulator [Actinomycetospora sp. CA-101289]|uniref:LysR family transcriptional regulator n=1 Tax=Actinomycetospora sp. CA-101289 TaxID=3239893 RepID=UPI003D987D88
MELRQLEAFVAVATELHFGRAAAKLLMAQPTLSDLVRRLERELGTPLLTRTTRRVALTAAGTELLAHAKVVLDDVAAARRAVERVTSGDGGTVRFGITPPVAPVLGPHLVSTFVDVVAGVDLVTTQLWLPALVQAVLDGEVDVGVTCGLVDEPKGLTTEVFCSEPLLVGLRPTHRLAGRDTVRLTDLASEQLGVTPESLFPAWALAQRQALDAVGIAPPQISLTMTDLAATRWMDQPELDWVLLIGSLALGHTDTVVRPVEPQHDVPFTVLWDPSRSRAAAVDRFVRHTLAVSPPPGWKSATGDLRDDDLFP